MKLLRYFISLATILCCIYSTAQTSPYSTIPAEGELPEIKEFHLYIDGDWARGSNLRGKITLSGPNQFFISSMNSYSTGTYVVISLPDDAIVTTPGDYTLTIPAGKYAVNGNDIPETALHYTIVDDATEFPEYTIFPSPGTYSAIPNGFSLTFDTEEAISVDASQIALFGPDGDINVTATITDGEPTVVITPVSAAGSPLQLTDQGEYVLVFPYNTIKAGTSYNRQRLAFTYRVSRDPSGNWSGEVVANPADGSVVDALKSISVTYVDAGSVHVNEHADYTSFPVLRNASTGVEITRGMVLASTNKLDISLITEVNKPGEYLLEIPTRIVYVDGEFPTETITLHYTIKSEDSDVKYSVSVNPADGSTLGANDVIVITFAGDGLASVTHNAYAWGTESPHFTNTFGGYNPPVSVQDEGLSSTLSLFYPFETDGEYTLVIPAGFYTVSNKAGDSADCSEIVLTYNVQLSGVADVSVDNIGSDVYNIQGCRVMRATTADDLRNLPAGIYIVNGKKILVR